MFFVLIIMGPKSKGCNTCKSRKVKCDETHPFCLRCQKGGLDCSGYAIVPRFVDEIPKMKRRKMVETLQIEDMKEKKARTTSQGRSVQKLVLAETFTPTNSLSLIGFRDDIVISFLVDKLAIGRAGQKEAIASGQSWILELPKMSHKSLAALGASFFGYAYKQRHVGLAAIKIYGSVLSDMRKCILNQEDVQKGGTMETITLMCMFEV
jgi:hypothetical protein